MCLAVSFDLDPIDWTAIAAIVGALVLVANYFLARSTRKTAEAASAQAKSSAELAEIARRELAVSSSARLTVARAMGYADVVQVAGTLEPTWGLGIYNTGGASAVVADVSTLFLPAGLGRLPGQFAAGATVLHPMERQLTLTFAVEPKAVEAAARSGDDWLVLVPYHDPGSTKLRRFEARLRPSQDPEGGWRWMVAEEDVK